VPNLLQPHEEEGNAATARRTAVVARAGAEAVTGAGSEAWTWIGAETEVEAGTGMRIGIMIVCWWQWQYQYLMCRFTTLCIVSPAVTCHEEGTAAVKISEEPSETRATRAS
jgi:hypothetical protein